MLATVAARVLTSGGHPAPKALAGLVDEVNERVPPIVGARLVGRDLEALTRAFEDRVLPSSL